MIWISLSAHQLVNDPRGQEIKVRLTDDSQSLRTNFSHVCVPVLQRRLYEMFEQAVAIDQVPSRLLITIIDSNT